MAANSEIEWCDHTFNPWIGCARVSPGCDSCYAERLARRRRWATWGARSLRRNVSASTWAGPRRWERRAMRSGTPTRVFCASLADVFDAHGPASERAKLWPLIRGTPHLTWLLLTKRPENVARFLPPEWIVDLPQNVHLGVSIESSPLAFRRAPLLLLWGFPVRFISAEPLLGPVDLRPFLEPANHAEWLICGGESGPGARPMHPEWVRSLRDQCVANGVSFFFKQWGQWVPEDELNGRERRTGRRVVLTPDGRVLKAGETAADAVAMVSVGKKRSGRLLDGREWNEFPVQHDRRIPPPPPPAFAGSLSGGSVHGT